ncbi:MAG: glycosyltransferase family 2 protein [Gemmatimonadales bacterium]
MSAGAKVSAIIPTLNGARTLPLLLDGLERAGSCIPIEIIAIDSGSGDATGELLRRAGATVLDLGGRAFGHASARNRAAARARGDILLFLTQDVAPAGEEWISALVAAFDDGATAGAFGRQVPRGASPEEAFLVSANYGERPRTLTAAAVDSFGPGATLFSTAFGAMRRGAWERHPLPDVVMSEDQAWARDVLRAGMTIRYVPEAAVYHGHRLSLIRAFRRNFDSGSSLQQLGLTGRVWSSGFAHLRGELAWISAEHGTRAVLHALVYEAVRMKGFQLGRLERWMPRALARVLGEAPRT